MDSYRVRYYKCWLTRVKKFINQEEYLQRDSVIAVFDAMLRDISIMAKSLDSTGPINKDSKLMGLMKQVPEVIKDLSERLINSRNEYEKEICRRKIKSMMELLDSGNIRGYNSDEVCKSERLTDLNDLPETAEDSPLREFYNPQPRIEGQPQQNPDPQVE